MILNKSNTIVIGSPENKYVIINGSLGIGAGAMLRDITKIDVNMQIPGSSGASVIDIHLPREIGLNRFTFLRPDIALVGRSRSFSVVPTADNRNVIRVTSFLPELSAEGVVSIVLADIQ